MSEESGNIPRAQPATLKQMAQDFLKTSFGVNEPQEDLVSKTTQLLIKKHSNL